MTDYILTLEGRDSRPLFFKALVLGLFWECTHEVEHARRFTTRYLASNTLTKNGKHLQGWRVIPAPKETK